MEKFCGKCGANLQAGVKFCPACGQPAEVFALKEDGKVCSNQALYQRLLGVLVVLIIVGIGGFFIYKTGLMSSNTLANDQFPDKPISVEQRAAEKSVEGSTLAKTQKVLEQNKIQGKVLATSLGNNTKGFLTIIKNNEQCSFIIFDQANQQIAEVPFSQEKYSFQDNVGQKYISPLIFNMTIFHDKHDRDEKNGVWNGENHLIPIYALYKFDQNGNVVPGMLHTAWGAKPSHYQGYLNEQKNVDIANLFLTEMKALRENGTANQISVPMN
ncbi:hypothetical protein SOV_52370 [Sporomusa ovata DSM 2662]|uniref:Zinc-ribbon domain-containing protein n=1 Tax=Sporomusa ovata TaxID=2378 RepID=A0A0U1KRC6_9FIRM|nr:zinc ribbon domain-containing protein [Sporomusa ovata]EQB27609.1 zinc-ribbon domain containing protein [Sporomusa ovata DSM 2662]CQR69962.1 hypothetical protein SpAn4DRAFT_4827 [Sporomusa ovata]